MKKNNKGFSLVELIVVMAIMAILVGAIAPQVVKYVEKARIAKDLQIVDTIYTNLYTEITSTSPTVTINPMTLAKFEEQHTTLYTNVMGLMTSNLNDHDKIDTALKSSAASSKTIILEYNGGKLKVGVGTVSGTTSTYVAGLFIEN